MALPRPSCLRGALGRSTLRRAGAQGRSNAFRKGGRRAYASGHEAKASSDLPWMIGSAVVTIPAATWLYGQAPTKSDHAHAHETEPKVVEDPDGDESAEKEPEQDGGGDDSKDESKSEEKSDEPKDEGKDEGKDEDKSDDSGSEDGGNDTPPPSEDALSADEESDKPSEGSQINKIGQSKGQKPRNTTEKKGEKDSAKDYSGAQHPYIDDESKSKKGGGVTETAKIHGTVTKGGDSSN